VAWYLATNCNQGSVCCGAPIQFPAWAASWGSNGMLLLLVAALLLLLLPVSLLRLAAAA
jgi:hypothetical protein